MINVQVLDSVLVVEHDEMTREPVPDGQILHGTVTDTGGDVIQVRLDRGQYLGWRLDVFSKDTGWSVWDMRHRWRLVALPAGNGTEG